MFLSLSLKLSISPDLHHYHSEDPGVDEVLHPVADGVDGVEAAVLCGAGVGLVWADQDSSLAHGELEVRKSSSGSESSGQAHQVIHRLPRVFDPPQAPGGLGSQIFDQKILQNKEISDKSGQLFRYCVLAVICCCFSVLAYHLL